MDAAAKNPSLSLRDTAIFAVAASLGLRAGDIVRLTLSDIDWIHHEIRFVQNKTGVELHLPLEASVGNAIANYILHIFPQYGNPLDKDTFQFLLDMEIRILINGVE